MKIRVSIGTTLALTALAVMPVAAIAEVPYFEKQASFFVCDNTSCDRDEVEETSAEIIDVSEDGMTLVYGDSPAGVVGFIDITDPANPAPLGVIPIDGEPTAVSIAGDYLLVGVNTSEDFLNPSGNLAVYSVSACLDLFDISNCTPETTIDLGGQPDSVAVSPDGTYAAVAIENERDEDACPDGMGGLIDDAFEDEDACEAEGQILGGLPQFPAGYLSVIDISGDVSGWSADTVDLTGLDVDVAPDDPEPEFVSINSLNQAIVSLQENNGYAWVDLATLTVAAGFSAGAVDLVQVDAEENDIIQLNTDLPMVPREPDGVTWINDEYFAGANEGDFLGGSRGFTIHGTDGSVVFETNSSFDYATVSVGHYPESRSENKGNEPEGVAFATFGTPGAEDGANFDLLFVGSERSNAIGVFDLTEPETPEMAPEVVGGEDGPRFHQVLSTGIAPEGLLPIPSRNLFVVAAENDEEIRSLVTIWEWKIVPPEYPEVASVPATEDSNKPIPFGALSALSADWEDPATLYTVHDSYYDESKMYKVDASGAPVVITEAITLTRDGETVNYDLEGIASRGPGRGFWLVSEGVGSVDDPDRPVEAPNLLILANEDGEVQEEIMLPASVDMRQRRFGLEGVAVTGINDYFENVWVVVQREWAGDPPGLVRILQYRPQRNLWREYWYPLEEPASPAGGWVGLSEIVAVGTNDFLILERDNQGGRDATIKRIYHVNPSRQEFTEVDGKLVRTVQKRLIYDLLPDLQARNGWVPDKPEGLTLAADGTVWVNTDNDGVDDSTGETFFFPLGSLADLLENAPVEPPDLGDPGDGPASLERYREMKGLRDILKH